MSIQTFTTGQTLTAAQMNSLQANDYNQTVSTKTASYTLVAADKGTRVVMNVASANTVTVNTSLFSAGDTLVIQNIGAGVCTVTAGTATVSSAGALAIPQFGSGTLYFTSAGVSIFFPSAGPAAGSGLTLINSGSVGTNTTFSLPTASFSATYLNYMLVWDNVRVATGAQNMLMRLRVSGTDDTSSNYYGFSFTVDGSGTYGALGNNADGWRFGGAGTAEQTSMVGVMFIYNPNVAQYTRFTNSTFGANSSLFGGGRHEVSTAYDSCTIYGHTSNAFTAGTYRLYGLADS